MNQAITCTYIGHATTLLKAGCANILTDPHFGKRTLIFPRIKPVPFPPLDLPELSCVLLSHTHFDHLNSSSYKYVSCGTPIIVPEGCERAIGKFVPNPIIELSHYANHELTDGTEITAVPLIHRSSRLSHLRFTKSNGYLIKVADSDRMIFFCADSAYGPHFAQIGNLAHIDLALLPIGSYNPQWLMKKCHMTPAEAVTAFEDLGAREMIPIHHGTFRLSLEPPDEPEKLLRGIIDERPELKDHIHILEAGESYSIRQ